ncbi:unnamed protein product [Ambrosiozyma monospora]|uniref:Unnamed protein product n=1 Tax=Ambrosiozyma monospora TaxID=43982 RepID=A0ACB5SZ48_AMBMO|nr:unnamed protein product [Ambrosiozyma monospora]
MIKTIFSSSKGYYLCNPRRDSPHPPKTLEFPLITNGFDQLHWIDDEDYKDEKKLDDDYDDYDDDEEDYSYDYKTNDINEEELRQEEAYYKSAYILNNICKDALAAQDPKLVKQQMLEEGDDESNDEDYTPKGKKKTKRSKQTPKQQRKEARLQKRKNKSDKKKNQGKQQDFDVLHLTSDIREKMDLLKKLYKEASKSDFDRVLKFYDITVYREDLFNLTDEEWLNDNNLSFIYEYLSRIQIKPTLKARMKYCKDSDLNQIMLLMPTFSFLLAHHPDPQELVDVLPPIKDSSFVFLPVNDNDDLELAEGGSHWSLILCCPKDRKCFIYDSMYLANDQESHTLVTKLEMFYGFQFEIITDKYTPQQINGSDCGILVLCLTALLLSRILNVDNNTYIDLSMKNVSVSALDARLFILGTIVNMMKDNGSL